MTSIGTLRIFLESSMANSREITKIISIDSYDSIFRLYQMLTITFLVLFIDFFILSYCFKSSLVFSFLRFFIHFPISLFSYNNPNPIDSNSPLFVHSYCFLPPFSSFMRIFIRKLYSFSKTSSFDWFSSPTQINSIHDYSLFLPVNFYIPKASNRQKNKNTIHSQFHSSAIILIFSVHFLEYSCSSFFVNFCPRKNWRKLFSSFSLFKLADSHPK